MKNKKTIPKYPFRMCIGNEPYQHCESYWERNINKNISIWIKITYTNNMNINTVNFCLYENSKIKYAKIFSNLVKNNITDAKKLQKYFLNYFKLHSYLNYYEEISRYYFKHIFISDYRILMGK